MTRAVFLGGPLDGRVADLSATPPVVEVGTATSQWQGRYERIDDPDTGEYLGGYAHAPLGRADETQVREISEPKGSRRSLRGPSLVRKWFRL